MLVEYIPSDKGFQPSSVKGHPFCDGFSRSYNMFLSVHSTAHGWHCRCCAVLLVSVCYPDPGSRYAVSIQDSLYEAFQICMTCRQDVFGPPPPSAFHSSRIPGQPIGMVCDLPRLDILRVGSPTLLRLLQELLVLLVQHQLSEILNLLDCCSGGRREAGCENLGRGLLGCKGRNQAWDRGSQVPQL